MSAVLAVSREIQENQDFRVILSYTGSEFKASLVYYMRPCQKNKSDDSSG